jgi:hypothetical protein
MVSYAAKPFFFSPKKGTDPEPLRPAVHATFLFIEVKNVQPEKIPEDICLVIVTLAGNH